MKMSKFYNDNAGVDINQSYQSFSILQREVINKWFAAFLNKMFSFQTLLFSKLANRHHFYFEIRFIHSTKESE